MQRILFVDDEPGILKSLQRMVRSHSIEAETEGAVSADEAIRRIEQGGIDIVVSDVRMPGMDGIELLTRLKGNHFTQNIPVIMLTGDGDTTIKNVAIELGAMEFINKPADPTELSARLRNVMRLKLFQDQLVNQNRILSEQIVQAQKMEIAGLLASQAAHDLNNILTAIMGNAELVLYKTSDWDVHPELKRVVSAAQHASQLVRQILKMGRSTSGPLELVDPSKVISETLDMLQVVFSDGISVVWSDPQQKTLINIDGTALYQAIMNLAVNASQAMGETGTLTIGLADEVINNDAAAEHEGCAPGRFTVISVSDTGPGMDAATLTRIFEPFFTTKGEGKGTGIGLSVVDRIVRDAGGFITVTSAPGDGTTFALHLPVTEKESLKKVSQEAAPASTPA
jgi:signal transduction histidine kinase